MARISPDDLKDLVSANDKVRLTPFIRSAAVTVDWLASQDSESLLNDERLELIELFLAAHFFEVKKKRTTNESRNGVSASFQGQTKMGFLGTDHGVHACELDLTGLLARQSRLLEEGSNETIDMLWPGTLYDDQTGRDVG